MSVRLLWYLLWLCLALLLARKIKYFIEWNPNPLFLNCFIASNKIIKMQWLCLSLKIRKLINKDLIYPLISHQVLFLTMASELALSCIFFLHILVAHSFPSGLFPKFRTKGVQAPNSSLGRGCASPISPIILWTPAGCPTFQFISNTIYWR